MKIRNLQENFDDTVESNGKQNTGMEIEEAENNVYEVLGQTIEANKSHNIIYWTKKERNVTSILP